MFTSNYEHSVLNVNSHHVQQTLSPKGECTFSALVF